MSKYSELADRLESAWVVPKDLLEDSATALRELEAENERLRKLAVGLAKLALRHGLGTPEEFAEAMELIATLEGKE